MCQLRMRGRNRLASSVDNLLKILSWTVTLLHYHYDAKDKAQTSPGRRARSSPPFCSSYDASVQQIYDSDFITAAATREYSRSPGASRCRLALRLPRSGARTSEGRNQSTTGVGPASRRGPSHHPSRKYPAGNDVDCSIRCHSNSAQSGDTRYATCTANNNWRYICCIDFPRFTIAYSLSTRSGGYTIRIESASMVFSVLVLVYRAYICYLRFLGRAVMRVAYGTQATTSL